MAKIFCQNKNCPFWKKHRIHKNYGKCTKETIWLVSLCDESYEVSGYNVSCDYSTQEREYVYREGE